MFPIIKTISDILPFVQENPQFRVAKQDNGYTVICYMLQDEDTFAGPNEDYSRECRGITFDREGNIASRTLHKFQNVGESEATQASQIPWDKVTRIMHKRDGSMITFLEIDGKIIAKTKKTFTSSEAIAATEFLHKDPRKVAEVKRLLDMGMTPVFEWTSPRFPIVLCYAEDQLTLLQVRFNDTGDYIDPFLIDLLNNGTYPFPIVENLISNFKNPRDLLELAKTQQDIEGWIIQTDFGEMWKIKTQWYCELHHAVTFTRWRDVAKAVLADEADDLKGAFAMTGRKIDPIVNVENNIHSYIATKKLNVEITAKQFQEQSASAKDVAMEMCNHPDFSLIMKAFRNMEIDWLEWYRKNMLDIWSLEVIPV